MPSRTSEEHAERLDQQAVDEEADREAGHGAGQAAAEQAEGDDQRRQDVGTDVEEFDLGEEGELQQHADQDPIATRRGTIFGVTITRASPPVSTWTRSRLRRSAKGRTWTCLLRLLLDNRGLGHFADRQARREERGEALDAPAGGDDGLAPVHVLGRVDEVEDQVFGVADFGLDHALDAVGTTLAEIALAWSVISVTCGGTRLGRRRSRPTSPSPLITGSLTLDAVAAADVDRHASSARPSASGRSPCR